MFLSLGEKIIKIRKKYKITQEELAGETISRTSLGMIETGKRQLSKKVAVILADNFNDLFIKKNIDHHLTAEDLMKDESGQAHDILEEKIKDTNITMNDIWDIDEALYHALSQDRIEYSHRLFEIYRQKNIMDLAKKYLVIFLHNAPASEKIIPDIFYLLEMYDKTCEYHMSLMVYDNFYGVLRSSPKNNFVAHINAMHAMALCMTFNDEKAIDDLLELIKKAKTDDEIFIYRKQLARIYMISGRGSEAIEEYSSLAKGKTSEIKSILNSTILDMINMSKDIEKIKKYYNRCIDVFEISHFDNKQDEYSILCILGKSAMTLGKENDAVNYFIRAYDIGKNSDIANNKQMYILGQLFDLFDRGDLVKVSFYEKEYNDLLATERDIYPAISILNWYRKYMPIESEKKFKYYKEFDNKGVI